jgi:hypothetical protein
VAAFLPSSRPAKVMIHAKNRIYGRGCAAKLTLTNVMVAVNARTKMMLATRTYPLRERTTTSKLMIRTIIAVGMLLERKSWEQ